VLLLLLLTITQQQQFKVVLWSELGKVWPLCATISIGIRQCGCLKGMHAVHHDGKRLEEDYVAAHWTHSRWRVVIVACQKT